MNQLPPTWVDATPRPAGVIAIAALCAIALAGCASHVRDAIPVTDPGSRSLCRQVVDHIESYITYVSCEEPDGQTGYFPALAETETRGPQCSEVNRVDHLPYRAPRVNDAVLSVMRRESQGDGTLQLFNNVNGIWVASLDESGWQRPDFQDATQAELWRLVGDVPWLLGGLVDRVLVELGSDETCLPERERAVDVSNLRSILERMGTMADDPTCAATATGLYRVDGIDPNIAVAISRVQQGDLAKVPSEAAVRLTLETMGVRLEGGGAGPDDSASNAR